ncbi:CPBP family intramembrane metalloprotease, partial [Mycobacterium tuberculosis]|nr:CPBP family intramembrane metalloprotease [Mycobacterium tuberculosis]
MVWLGLLGAQIVGSVIVIGLGLPFTSNTEGIDGLAHDRTYVISLLVSAVLAAPLVEEMVFRGVILRGLRSRWSAPLAVA